MVKISTNAVIGQDGGSGGNLIYANNPSNISVSSGDKVLVNLNNVTTLASIVDGGSDSSQYHYTGFIMPLPNNDLLAYKNYYTWNPDTNSWNRVYNNYSPDSSQKYVPFRHGNKIACKNINTKKPRYYDYSLSANGDMGERDYYFFHTVDNGGFALKYDTGILYSWNGEYTNEAVDTDGENFNTNIGSDNIKSNSQYFAVYGNKIIVSTYNASYIIDTTNFPNCSIYVSSFSTDGVNSTNINVIGCTGDDNGDYDLRWLTDTNIKVKRKTEGVWTDATLPFLDYSLKASPYYDFNSKILSCINSSTQTVHLYKFNNETKEFSEINLSDLITTNLVGVDLKDYVNGSRPVRIFTSENEKEISFNVSTASSAGVRRIYLMESTELNWQIMNNSSIHYSPLYSVTGVVTGNVDTHGKIEILTVLSEE